VKVCVAYQIGGRTVEEMPLDAEALAAATPVYEELDGWPDAAASDLPISATAPAARFVARIESLTGIPVWATSWGPGRSETILTRELFPSEPVPGA
jgi:adenylosuccinate synthase